VILALEALWRVVEAQDGSVLARPLAERYPELEAIEGLPPMPEIPVWLVGHRALRSLPRIKAVWALLEELTSEFP